MGEGRPEKVLPATIKSRAAISQVTICCPDLDMSIQGKAADLGAWLRARTSILSSAGRAMGPIHEYEYEGQGVRSAWRVIGLVGFGGKMPVSSDRLGGQSPGLIVRRSVGSHCRVCIPITKLLGEKQKRAQKGAPFVP